MTTENNCFDPHENSQVPAPEHVRTQGPWRGLTASAAYGLEKAAESGGELADLASWFSFAHLDQDLQVVSRLFAQTAGVLLAIFPSVHPQLRISLQRLIEAKDAAVRAEIARRRRRLIGAQHHHEQATDERADAAVDQV